MPRCDGLTTAEIHTIFADEIREAGGTVSETFDDGSRLFTRSILPRVLEVRPRDRVQGGVALKATEEGVWVHPYVFRQVCRNGAIMAHALQTEHIENLGGRAPEEAAFAVRAAVRACSVEEAFTAAAEAMRSAQATPTDLTLNLMPLLSRLPPRVGAEILRGVMTRFVQDADPSRFGLMNAVTAVARDTRDPDLRWRLEEFGGGIPAARIPAPAPGGAAARRVLVG